MIKLTCLVLIILSFGLIHGKLDKNKVLIAINCGGDEYIDRNGIDYIAVNNLI